MMPEIPSGYLPLNEAWPEWLSRRYPKSKRKILDPETYRPVSLVNSKSIVACDIISGDPVMGYDPPDDAAIAHANSLQFRDFAEVEVGKVENEFWHEFCNFSGIWAPERYPRWTEYYREHPDRPVLIYFRNTEWHRVAKGQWEALRLNLWKEIVAEDLQRADHGPMRWYARVAGEIPSGYAVDRAAFSALLSYGPDDRELSDEEQERLLVKGQGAGRVVEAAESRVSQPNSALKAFSEVKAKAAYRKRVSDWQPSVAPPSRCDDLQFMRNLYPGLSRDAVRKLRKEFAPEEWRRQGRRSGNKLARN